MFDNCALKQTLLNLLYENATKLRDLSFKFAGFRVHSILTIVSNTIAKVYNMIDSLQQITISGIDHLLFAVVDLLNQTMSITLFAQVNNL